MVTTGRHFTFADLLALPDDGEVYDILGGDLTVHNVPELNHGLVASDLSGLLLAASRAGYGFALTNTHAVALDFPQRGHAAEHVTHPDLSFVRRERGAILGERAVQGVPDLIIEILSPTTSSEHSAGGAIRKSYELHGVPYNWLVDVPAGTIQQYTLLGEPYASGRYGEPALLQEGAILTCPLFPDVSRCPSSGPSASCATGKSDRGADGAPRR